MGLITKEIVLSVSLVRTLQKKEVFSTVSSLYDALAST